jgi:hypothetical protein
MDIPENLKKNVKTTRPAGDGHKTEPKIDTPRGQKVPVQLKVDIEVLIEFKTLAAQRNMKLNDLFTEMLREYQSK